MATSGNDNVYFSGTLTYVNKTIINAYTGYNYDIDDELNLNNSIYDGLAGTDSLILTSYGDGLFLVNDEGQQTLYNIETILASSGGDVIDLSSTTIVLGNMTISGSSGDDIIWANAGNDTLVGGDGNDILDGGPGNDSLIGGNGDDIVFGGDGNDTIFGNAGSDYYNGGSGSDTYYYNNFSQVGPVDTIVETEDGAMDQIVFATGSSQDVTLENLFFTIEGNDLRITITKSSTGATSDILIVGQYDSASSGIDQIVFSAGTFDLRSIEKNYDPEAQDDSFSGNEDSDITGNVLANDSDANSSDILSVEAQTLTTAAGGTVVLLASGDFTYTPADNYNGTDSFEYTVMDGNGGSASATVSLDIISVNDTPVAIAESFSGNEDEAIIGNVLANDSDVDGDALSVEAQTITTAAGGTVELLANGDFTYTPMADYNGADSFEYTVSDGNGGTAVASVDLTIAAVNDAPVAGDDTFSGDEDTVISGNVLGNDSDIDGDALSVVEQILTTAAGGTVELLANGDFTYTPAADYYGTDSFEYTVNDGNGGSDTAMVNLNIADVVDSVASNLDIRVSHGNIATKYINSTDGYDLEAHAYGVTETVNAATMDVAGASANAQVSYSYADANTASVTLDSAWNSMKNVEVSSETAGNITLSNFVHTDVTFGNGGDSIVDITGAKRGFITTGDGNDTITIVAKTNDANWSNIFDIKTGDGHDGIEFTGSKGISKVLIEAGDGHDDATLHDGYETSYIDMGAGDDRVEGGTGKDTIYGGTGNDHLEGGNGDDILYGGNNDLLIFEDKEFNDSVLFPALKERVNIKNLDPNGETSLGVQDPNLNVEYHATAEITFRNGYAGYNNSLGIYSIAADGTIQMASILWENVKDAGFNTAHTIDIPGSENGGDFGFFIIADGDNANTGYAGLDTSEVGNIQFIYHYGQADERAAKITDDGDDISVIYDDGITEQLLNGNVYSTTERGGSNDINADEQTHSVSGLADADNTDVLKIGFEDLWNLGDGDYEDVLFELNINKHVIDLSEQGNDYLDGGAGNDVLYGEGGNDILIGGSGNDTLNGGTGSDMFVFTTTSGKDTVEDFNVNEGDMLNITDILEGFDAGDDLSDFVHLVISGNNTQLQVNSDGHGGDFKTVAVIENVIVTDSVDQLLADGVLIVDQSAIV